MNNILLGKYSRNIFKRQGIPQKIILYNKKMYKIILHDISFIVTKQTSTANTLYDVLGKWIDVLFVLTYCKIYASQKI